jgi:predicted peptidase
MKLITLVSLIALPVLAQFSAEDQMRFCAYTNETGEVFSYRMAAPQFPAEGRSYPLIIFLHGSGECGTDNKRHINLGLPALIKSLLLQNQKAVILALQCQRGNWWVQRLAMRPEYKMSKEPTASMEVLMELVSHIKVIQPVDPDRVYITGFSLGGFGTWDAIQRWPDVFAAAVPICGGGDLKKAKSLKQMPLWVFHGDADKNVPVDCSRRMVEAIRKTGGRKYKYTEYPRVAHNSWDKAYGDQEMVAWLLSQRKSEKKPFWKFW